ncbi:MAG: SPOR domain-containing protein [Alcaligenaceae bacterium]|nr:SPOR domain-containing protein [Alcaligenaceae bacterium]
MALFGSGKNQRPSAQYEQKRSNSRQQDRYQNEREMREQRVRSRNRLLGSVILVMVAVIVLPLILKTGDDTSKNTITSAPLIAPDSNIGQGSLVIEGSTSAEIPSDSDILEEFEESAETQSEGLSIAEGGLLPGESIDSPLAIDGALSEEESDAQTTAEADSSSVSIAESTAAQSEVEAAEARARAEQEAAAKEERAKREQARAAAAKAEQEKKQQASAAASNKRTDDGSKALAILEGREAKPAASTAAPAVSSSAEFSLQVASYSSSGDARTQRDRLRSSGVSNAYIQSATVNGKQVFRLRVGPFSSREAAQAAQTRLRALNFSDSFVTGR